MLLIATAESFCTLQQYIALSIIIQFLSVILLESSDKFVCRKRSDDLKSWMAVYK